MKKSFIILTLIITLFSCKNTVDTRKELRSDIENSVQLNDKLVIFTGACKGCQFSTTYGFYDSLGIIKEDGYKYSDDCPDCAGGSYNVEVEFTPKKTGKTVLKMYQHVWENSAHPIVVDSVLVATYIIEVNE